MQNVAILSAAIGVASAKQVIFAGDGGVSGLYGVTNGSAFEALGTPSVPAGVFTDDCFDVSSGLPFGTPAWGKFTCDSNNIVVSYGVHGDSGCKTNFTQPKTFTEPEVPLGPVDLGFNFNANPSLNKPFDQFQSMTGYCLSTPLKVFLRIPFTAASCTTQAKATPVGTNETAGYASDFPAQLPYAAGKCYSTDLTGAMIGKFAKLSDAGITLYDNSKPTSLTMTAAQCTDTDFAATGPFFSSGTCKCSFTAVANVTVSRSVCSGIGASCLKADGTAVSSGQNGTCAFLAGASNTDGGDAAEAGTLINQCGYATGLPAGTYASGKCTCYGDTQCASGYYCFQANGQKATNTTAGTCGYWAPLAGSVEDPGDEAAYTACSSSANQALAPLNTCEATTNSIWKVASANMFAVSAASVVVAMTSLFA